MSKNLATSALPLQTEVLPPGKSQVGRGAVSGGAPGERWEPVSGRNLPAKCEYFRTPEPLRHVHGLGLSMVGTPRAVTASSREQQVSIEISDLGDFAKRTTSFSTGADVGSPTQAPILAQIAEPCINEMRKGEASKGQWLTIIFNAVQTASFAQASGAALAGNGQVTGGSDNYHAKPPVVNKFQSDFQCTAGMFDRFQWAGDLGVPTGKNVLADRIGYPSEASGNVEGERKLKHKGFDVSPTGTPHSDLTVESNCGCGYFDYGKNLGQSRVLQPFMGHKACHSEWAGERKEAGVINHTDASTGGNVVKFTGPIVERLIWRLRCSGEGSHAIKCFSQTFVTGPVQNRLWVKDNQLSLAMDRGCRAGGLCNLERFRDDKPSRLERNAKMKVQTKFGCKRVVRLCPWPLQTN